MNRQHILDEIIRTAAQNGGVPLGHRRFLQETGIKVADWQGRYWARWNDVLRDAGFEPNQLVEARDDSTLLDLFSDLTLELGRIPVSSEMRLKSALTQRSLTTRHFPGSAIRTNSSHDSRNTAVQRSSTRRSCR